MKILFIYQQMVSFVEKDLEILHSAHEVKTLRFRSGRYIFADLIRMFFLVLWCDITFSWFGKLHTFFAVLFSKLFRKKLIVVSGGDEVANMSAEKYGMFAFWWKRWCPLFVFRHADRVLCISGFNKRETIMNAHADEKKITLIYHGFDSQKYKKVQEVNKERLVITVGGVDWERTKRKGYEVFVKSAAFLPDVKFILVGKWYDDSINYLKKVASENVKFTESVSQEELAILLGRAKVYVQASQHEAFGCSLAEAMLCECVPVVTRKAAIPEVVGDTGVYVDSINAVDVTKAIQYALALPADYGAKARERIAKEFPLEKRKQQLLQVVDELAKKNG